MKGIHLIISAGLCGVLFAIIVRYMGMSPSKYMLDNYGMWGLILYAVVALGICGILLYYATRSERLVNPKKQSEAKE